MTEVRFNSVDNETGVSYAVVVAETEATVGVVTREEGQRVWVALATGRKVALKEEFGTRKAAAEALVQIAKEKLARAEERKAARAEAKAAEAAAAAIVAEVVAEEPVEEPTEAVKAEVCCGDPETCEAECPAPVADPVEVQTSTGTGIVWSSSSANSSSTGTSNTPAVTGGTLTGSIRVAGVEKPKRFPRLRKIFGRKG